MDQLIIHYSYEGNLIPMDSEEAKSYLQKENHRSYNEWSIINYPVRFCLDGTQILPTALLDVYNAKEKIKINQSDENFECKTSFISLNEHVYFWF
jgi:hypothetical protein